MERICPPNLFQNEKSKQLESDPLLALFVVCDRLRENQHQSRQEN